MAQKNAITIRASADLLKKLDADASKEFSSRSEVAAMRLELIYASGEMPPAAPLSEEAELKKRTTQIANERAEISLAKEQREVIRVDSVLALVSKEFGVIRSRLLQLPQAVNGLTPDQVAEMKKVIQDLMTDLSGKSRETWDKADEV